MPKSPQETLAEAKTVASSIFRKIGVEISWSGHSFSSNSVDGNLNREQSGPKLQLRILNRQMTEKLLVNKTMTGLAFQGTAGQPGRVANVSYHRVEDLAKSKTCSKGEILGHAAAHESGHLLLGSLEHPSTGLMKARLEHKDSPSCRQRRPSVFSRGSCAHPPGYLRQVVSTAERKTGS